jgi:anionic cell wall polymer biosynthesis LytR-Cps2A-Psr (LCP) family protein
LGIKIPYYATIDFTAFKEIVDAIGGIDIIVPETLHDTTYPNEANRGYITFHIDAGAQHLDGDTALKYARSRHSTSDFSRSLRQQLIIMGIKDKVLGSGLNIQTVQQLYDQYKTYISTNVSLPEMLRTVQYLNSLKAFDSFGFTTNCSFQNYLKMPSACFLYYPEREAFGGASVMLPMGATVNKIQHYTEMQVFTDFIVAHQAFVQQKTSIEVINGIDKALARSKGMSATPFA